MRAECIPSKISLFRVHIFHFLQLCSSSTVSSPSMACDPSNRSTALRVFSPALVGLLLLLSSSAGWTEPAPAPPEGKPAPGAKPEGRPRPEHRADELTPEERKHLDQVLAEAWKDPSVMAAREQVHAATDAYRKTLRDAVSRLDPSAVPLMGKLHDKSRLEAVRRKLPMDGAPGMPPQLPKDPEMSIQVLATQEANLRHLEGPDRERFLQLARQIQEEGTLKPLIRQTYDTWTRGGRDAAKSRRELRDQLLAKMRQKDVWAADLLKSDPLARKGAEKNAEKGPEAPAH
ncbi:MAG: hypothetical protein DVB23_000930 [Verrucomicrobia bacterium]|jgi:hypothetical protein|nr:MAG: hypothetical protein DVB23_000930 [Verrucomicrobiota bacterium]